MKLELGPEASDELPPPWTSKPNTKKRKRKKRKKKLEQEEVADGKYIQ
jgi:hypothetical protein